MRNIKILFLLLTSVILFSCKDNPSNPVIPDGEDVYIDNDSSIINTKEYFNGTILGNDFNWTEYYDSRLSYHGTGTRSVSGDTFYNYTMGMNTNPYKKNDYILYIYSPDTKSNDFTSVRNLFTPGIKNLEDFNHEPGSGFRIYVVIIDEISDSLHVTNYRYFSTNSGTQNNSYLKILSRVVTEKDGYCHIKLKMKLLCNLYSNDGKLAGTIKSNNMLFTVYYLKL